MAGDAALQAREFRRILLIKLSSVGDVVHTLPVLVKLRQRYPAARIDWLIKPECADLVRCHPALSGTVGFPRRSAGGTWAQTARMTAAIRAVMQARYELVVDLQGQLRSAAFALASLAPVRIGFSTAREGARLGYSHRIAMPSLEQHAADRSLRLGELLGFAADAPDFTLHLPPEAAPAMAALLALNGLAGRRFAVLVPGTLWQTKHWGVEGFAAVGRHLAGRGLGIVLAGGVRDRALAAGVAAACPGAIDLAGQTTLGQLAALLRQAAICVSNDSGPMHLAVALGIPVVAAFGPTNPVRTGPYGRPDAVVRTGIACSPCYIRELRRCPHQNRCMTEITAAMMIDRIERTLAA